MNRFCVIQSMKKLSLALLIMVLSVVAACRKEKASWNSNWIFPLIKDTLAIENFVNDSTLSINADNSIQFTLHRDVFNIDLFSVVKIPDTTIQQTFAIGFSSLTLAPGTQYVNQTEEHYFDLGEPVLLQTRTKSGKAFITIQNPIPTMAIFQIDLPGVTKDGNEFSQTENVPAAVGGDPGIKTIELNLAGYAIDMTGQNQNLYNTLQSKMTVTTDSNGPTVTITNNDVVKFDVHFTDLIFDYAKGYFGHTNLTDTSLIELPALNAITDGTINLEEINFDVNVSNGIKVMAVGEITQLKSINQSGNEVSLIHPQLNSPFNIDPASGSWSTLAPFEYPINFNNTNSNIVPFLENIGNKYELGYQVEINPWGNISAGGDELYPQSRLKLALEANFPLSIGMDNLTVVDTFEVNLNEQPKAIRVVDGNFQLKVKNSFPFGGSMELHLLDASKNLISTISSTDVVDPAPINQTNDGHLLVENDLFFPVSETVVNELSEVHFITLVLSVNSNSWTNNQIYSNAAITFQLLTNFQLKTTL